jgi:hypothetical protein
MAVGNRHCARTRDRLPVTGGAGAVGRYAESSLLHEGAVLDAWPWVDVRFRAVAEIKRRAVVIVAFRSTDTPGSRSVLAHTATALAASGATALEPNPTDAASATPM